MKRTSLCLLASLLFITGYAQHSRNQLFKELDECQPQRSSGSFIYDLNVFMDSYADLTGATSINNGEIWDEPEYTFPVAFPFELLSNPVSSFTFGGAGSAMLSPTNDPDISTLLFPFETDLIDRGAIGGTSLSPISYKVEGPNGNRILKLEFKNAGSYIEMADQGTLDMFINFQMWLYEGSNTIEFRFGPSSIDDPAIFYGGMTGAFLGFMEVDLVNQIYYDPHLLIGPPPNPILFDDITAMDGTPPNGIVYQFTIELPLELEVLGENSTSTCDPNGSATANASGGVEPYDYLWSNNATTQTITNLSAGAYSVTVTDASSTVATGSVTITGVNPIIVNAFATDETSVGANDGTASASPTGGSPPYEYEWSNGETTALITGLSPGVYTVTVTDDSGCTEEESVTVNPFGCPDISVEAAITHVSCFGLCDGAIEIVQVIGGSLPFSLEWSDGSTGIEIVNACSGPYTVTITDSDGCTVIETYTINEPPVLSANAAATDASDVSANDGTAWASPTGGTPPYSYIWSNGSTDSLIINLPIGSYTVTVTDANACTDVESVEVFVAVCGIESANIAHNTCFQSCDGSISLTLINVVQPVTYLWTNGATTPDLVGLCSGTIGVTITDAEGCIVEETFVITQPSEVLANVGSTDETGPNANDGTAWAAPTGGTPPYSYEWSNGSTDSLITGLSPDFYWVIVSDANACKDTQVVFIDNFPCMGTILLEYTEITCGGVCDGTAAVNVQGGVGPYTYNWSTGDTDSLITDLCVGFYDVTISDEGQGCTAVESVFLDAPAEINILVDDVIHTTDTSISEILISVTGGTPPFTFSWTGPGGYTSSVEDPQNLEPGLYDLVVTDANGCTSEQTDIEVFDFTIGLNDVDQLDISFRPNPASSIVIIDPGDITEFASTLSSTDGRVVYSGQNDRNINVSTLTKGIYVLRITSGEKYFVRKLVIER